MSDGETTARAAQQAPSSAQVHAHASLSRRAVLAHLRHELRTPINAIVGYSEMLIEEAEDRRQNSVVADLTRIRTAGMQVRDLVDLFLDPARAEASLGSMDPERFEARLRHDLRVPINTIVGYAELLQEDAKTSDRAHLVPDFERIRAAGEGLLEVINGISKLSNPEEAHLDTSAGSKSALAQDAVTSIHAPRNSAAVAWGGERSRLLVVDDTATTRDLLSRRLMREGYAVAVAGNGREALERIRTEGFDLVLLDIMMPELNGFEVLKRIKSDERLRHIPIIMISALDESESVVQCIERGAEDYLPKPFDPVLLRARIGSSLERKRLRDREQAYLQQLRIERERAERLLLNVLPQPIVDRLKRGETVIADSFSEVTVLFADLVEFTELSGRIAPAELVQRLNEIFSTFDELAERYGLEKIKTIGDAYMVVGGVPTPRAEHAEAIAEMALDMMQATNRAASGDGKPFRIRAGIHTGPVVAGIIGTAKFAYDLWGDTVNIASRMESHGIPGSIQVSPASYARLRNKYVFAERGVIELKGKGSMQTYLLTGRKERITARASA